MIKCIVYTYSSCIPIKNIDYLHKIMLWKGPVSWLSYFTPQKADEWKLLALASEGVGV